jgi:hypothetical protein
MREEGPEMLYGDTYDPYGEYDAVGVFSGITAETGFSYDGIRQTVSLDIEDVAYTGGECLLPERIANPCRGGSVFLKPMGYRFSALEEIYLCETEYGYVLPNDLKKIGRIKVASGNTTQNVTVYMGDKGYPARGERTPAGEYHHVPAKDAVTEKGPEAAPAQPSPIKGTVREMPVSGTPRRSPKATVREIPAALKEDVECWRLIPVESPDPEVIVMKPGEIISIGNRRYKFQK